MSLHIADGLDFPDEAVTESFGILGQRGSGKTTAGVVMAEEMYRAGLPWVAIDPKGDWWGVRAEGTGPGLAVPVLGGLHGDVPLEAAAGALIADLVADENLTCVIDVSDFTLTERHRFLVDFAERLYRRHRQAPQRRHVFLEEAHEYIPQQVTGERARVKEAVARIPLMGRAFGLGSTTMSQRSARLHKDVLTQVGTLVAMRTTGPQDRRAILDWVEQHAVARELVDSLPGLDDGEAWIWSPRFLRTMERVRIRRRTTFDSGATPASAGTRPPATLADVDLDALRTRMAATIERAKADDPKELRRRIAELERQLRERPTEPVIQTVETVVEVPALAPGVINGLRANVDVFAGSVERVVQVLTAVRDGLDRVADGRSLKDLRVPAKPATGDGSREPAPTATMTTVTRSYATGGNGVALRAETPDPASRTTAEVPLGRAERALLAALIAHRAGLTKVQLSLVSGYSRTSSSFSNALGKLRSLALVERSGEPIVATPAGLAAPIDVEPLPAPGPELIDYWRGQLGRAERAFLDAFVAAYPGGLDKASLAEATGYSATSSSFGNALGRLRGLGLAEGWRASDWIMGGG